MHCSFFLLTKRPPETNDDARCFAVAVNLVSHKNAFCEFTRKTSKRTTCIWFNEASPASIVDSFWIALVTDNFEILCNGFAWMFLTLVLHCKPRWVHVTKQTDNFLSSFFPVVLGVLHLQNVLPLKYTHQTLEHTFYCICCHNQLDTSSKTSPFVDIRHSYTKHSFQLHFTSFMCWCYSKFIELEDRKTRKIAVESEKNDPGVL